MLNANIDVSTLSDADRARLIRALLVFPLDIESFYAWCERTQTCPMEFCILDHQLKNVLLFQRAHDDPFFSSQYHFSGTLLVPGEVPGRVWDRLRLSPKYNLSVMDLYPPTFVQALDIEKGPQSESKCPRGHERSMIHVVRTAAESATSPLGTWTPLHEAVFPKVIGHHVRVIRDIVIPWVSNQK